MLTKEKTNNSKIVSILEPNYMDEVAMNIDASAMQHIIEKLTDLYSNPIEALVREIISNAIDATVLVEKDNRKPIEITLPKEGLLFNQTVESAIFTVRDSGVGMSLETVKEIYSQYGASTKRHDFSQVGAFGLGAKAPLAYCDEFIGITTQDGMTTEFLVSRGNRGNTVKVIRHVKTNDENGTVFSFPVEEGDKWKFREAVNVYRESSFDTLIKIDDELIDSNDKYRLLGEIVLDDDTQTMGRVWLNTNSTKSITNLAKNVFTDNTDKIKGMINFVLSGWSYKAHNYYVDQDLRNLLKVELKPGLVDFTSSRDEITKNERFSKFLDKVVEELSKKLEEFVLDLYKTMTNAEATSFIKNNVSKINDDGTATVYNRYFEINNFKTKSGFNPFKDIDKTNQKIFNAVMYVPTFVDSRNKITACEFNFNQYTNFAKDYLQTFGTSVIATNTGIRKALIEHNECELREFVVSYINEINDNNNILVLTNCDEANVTKFLNLRKPLQETMLKSTYVIFANGDLKAKKMEKVLKEFFPNISSKIEDINKVIEHGKSILKNTKRINKSSTKKVKYYDGLYSDKWIINSSITELYNNRLTSDNYYYSQKTLSGFNDDDLLVLFNIHSDTIKTITETIRGANENGVDIFNKRIRLTPTKFSAVELEEILNDYSIIVTNNYEVNSKRGRELLEEVTYSSTKLSQNELDIIGDKNTLLKDAINLSYTEKSIKNLKRAFELTNVDLSKHKRLNKLFEVADVEKNRKVIQAVGIGVININDFLNEDDLKLIELSNEINDCSSYYGKHEDSPIGFFIRNMFNLDLEKATKKECKMIVDNFLYAINKIEKTIDKNKK